MRSYSIPASRALERSSAVFLDLNLSRSRIPLRAHLGNTIDIAEKTKADAMKLFEDEMSK